MTSQAPKVPSGVDQQVEAAKKQAEASGFGGTAYVDAHPSTGLIRIKLKLKQEEKLAQFIQEYMKVITMSLTAMNIEVGLYTSLEED
jgi:hypothetical protein